MRIMFAKNNIVTPPLWQDISKLTIVLEIYCATMSNFGLKQGCGKPSKSSFLILALDNSHCSPLDMYC